MGDSRRPREAKPSRCTLSPVTCPLLFDRDVAQLEERPLWEREVRGSSPRVSTLMLEMEITGRSSARSERSLRVREARGSNPRVPTDGDKEDGGFACCTLFPVPCNLQFTEGWQSGRLRAGANREDASVPGVRIPHPPLVDARDVAQRKRTRREAEGSPVRTRPFRLMEIRGTGLLAVPCTLSPVTCSSKGGWQSGRMRPSRKREPHAGPGVRIPHLPLFMMTSHDDKPP